MKDKSGQAFPKMLEDGMTLRDYFAAKASDEDIKDMQALKPEGYITRQCARYMHAAAMIEEREK